MMKKKNLARRTAFLWAICLTACTTAEDAAPAAADCNADSEQLIGFEQLFSMYRGEVAELTLDQVVEGFVISSDAAGNIFGSIYLQDQLANPSYGLELKTDLLETDARFPPGSRVRVRLRGLSLGKQEDGFALGSRRDIFGNAVLDRLPALATLEHLYPACDPGGQPLPRAVPVDSLRADWVHTLLRLDDMEVSGSYSDSLFAVPGTETLVPLEDCTGIRIDLVNSGYSDFQGQRLPAGSGSATGILLGRQGDFRLLLRRASDLDLQDLSCAERFPPVRSERVIISELADPDNEPDARFLELYNSGDEAVNLRGWSLLRYTNANTEAGAAVDLGGLVMQARATLVFSARPETFQAVYGRAPDVVIRINGPADSNGDDTIVLMNPFGEVADIFGLPGEDGSGTAHEFEDGGAMRRAGIQTSNPIFTPEEWQVYNDSGGYGTENLPRLAPADFTPGLHSHDGPSGP